MPDIIGKTLGGYRIIEQIGLGGMATVFKAFQPSMDRYVALKILSTHLTHLNSRGQQKISLSPPTIYALPPGSQAQSTTVPVQAAERPSERLSLPAYSGGNEKRWDPRGHPGYWKGC